MDNEKPRLKPDAELTFEELECRQRAIELMRRQIEAKMERANEIQERMRDFMWIKP